MLEPQGKMGSKAASKLVFVMFYALGTLSHVPQNFYITANDYWMYKFRNPYDESVNSSSTTEKTDLQVQFSSRYNLVAHTSGLISIILTFLVRKKISLQHRIIGSLSAMVTLLITTLIFVWADTDSWQQEFFAISLVIAGLLNGSGSCFMISIFQLAIKFPPVYLASLLSGQAICGILVALVQIITLAMGTTSKVNAFIFFSIGVVLILSVAVIYLMVAIKVDYFQAHMKSKQIEEPMVVMERNQIKTVAKKLAPILLTMVMTAGSGVMLHPGVTSLVESVAKGSGKWADLFFVSFSCFFLYNTFDFIGRECALRWNWIGGTYVMLVVAILRLTLVPLLLLCNIQPRTNLPVIFDEDYAYIIFIILFAFSTGYLANLCINQIQSVCTPEEKQISMFLTMAVMIVGMVTCSFLSSVIIKLI